MTSQHDRQDEKLTGQLPNQSGHCPLTGRYFEPWVVVVVMAVVVVVVVVVFVVALAAAAAAAAGANMNETFPLNF